MPGRVQLKPLPPEAAIRAFRQRGAQLMPSFAWQDVVGEQHARAFTVAKTAGFDLALEVLAALEAGVRRALEEGRTLRQFQDELTPILQRLGWWGRKKLYDDKTERTREVQLGSPRRLRIIFDANLRVSHAAAAWERGQRLKHVFPYLRYVAVLDERTRPMHAHWHGTILPVDHPWWETHFPPNGWNCRCSVMQISARDLARRGWTVTEPAPSAPERTFVNRRTGQTETVPEGIDPGWAYNPGAAALRARQAKDETGRVEAVLRLGAPYIDKLAAAPADLTQAQIEAMVRDWMPRFAADPPPTASLPVMRLPDPVAKALGAKTPIVVLSGETMIKNRREHPELSLDEYRLLPAIGAAPTVVIQQNDRTVLIVRKDDRLHTAAVKTTRSGSASFATSFRRTSEKDVLRMLRTGSKIYGTWEV